MGRCTGSGRTPKLPAVGDLRKGEFHDESCKIILFVFLLIEYLRTSSRKAHPGSQQDGTGPHGWESALQFLWMDYTLNKLWMCAAFTGTTDGCSEDPVVCL